MKQQNKIEIKRSEQIGDIVERMPVNGVKWVLFIVMLLVVSMLIFGFIIKYPEVVSGSITITTNKAPVVLVSKSSGRLQLLGNSPRIRVKEGQVFALFYNAARLDDLLLADSLLNSLQGQFVLDTAVMFPVHLNLGDLNTVYYQFVSSYEKLLRYHMENVFEMKEQALKIALSDCDSTLKYGKDRLTLKEKQLAFYRREVSRDSLRLKIGDYIEREFERTENAYHTMLENYRSLQESVSTALLRKESLNNQLAQLRIERSEKESDMRTEYMHALNSLQSGIEQWKESFAFVAPIDGIVEFLDFWRENDFVPSGREVFSVIPGEGSVYGHMLLPSQGAGKVKKGQTVTIQLNDYPYLEFGSIKGEVSSISLITNTKHSNDNQGGVDTYLLTVALPDGLTTKFGAALDFRYEIKGMADVQTHKRRLIERLFDNLKYISRE